MNDQGLPFTFVVKATLPLAFGLIGILLAASTGIIGASVVLLGLISLPVMLGQGYSRPLACGTVCSAGTQKQSSQKTG